MCVRKPVAVISASILLIIGLLFSTALAAENPWGHNRVLGYKDPIPTSSARKFTPFAILQDVAYAKDLNLYLDYTYARMHDDMRLWKLRLMNALGETVSTHHDVVVVLPYPSIWSETNGDYWKWTKNYASRYDWYYVRGKSSIHYYRTGYGGESSANSYLSHGGYLRLGFASFTGQETVRSVQRMNNYGCEIYFGKGFKEKSVLCQFVGSGEKPKDLIKTFGEPITIDNN